MRERSRARRILLTIVALGVVAAAAGVGSYAAFSSQTSNGGNSFASGTVVLTDDDAGGAMLSMSNAKPGDTVSGCIKVTYSGSLAANVHLYASQTGSLGQYLNLTVTRGTGATFASCAGFTADTTNYLGSGAGVIYSGTLQAYPATYAAGVVDPSNCGSPPCSAQTWNNTNNHVYKFVVTLADNNSAQGLSGTAGFTWEAQNT
jgi:predicted ribosomally synthesized peptide with SipW-like signal peptide